MERVGLVPGRERLGLDDEAVHDDFALVRIGPRRALSLSLAASSRKLWVTLTKVSGTLSGGALSQGGG